MYLSNLPNLLYPSLNPSFNSSSDVDEVKNFFVRVSINEDIFQNVNLYEKYKIIGNDRPDNVAEKVYGNPDLDWLVLLTNNIIDFYNEWPMSDTEFYDHLTQKYAGKNYNDTIYYVTQEIRDSSNRILLKGDLRVDSDFTFYNPEKQVTTNPVVAKSYFDFEQQENDKKRSIFLLKKEYASEIGISNLETLFYEKTKKFVNKTLREA
jgi:hypothetical protein